MNWQTELRRAHTIRQWQDRLQDIDSVFARLVYVAALRDSSGRYADADLLIGCTPRVGHRVIADAHRQIFREWLQLSARSKTRDLDRYATTLLNPSISEHDWMRLCRELIPSGISVHELKLFCEHAERLAPVLCASTSQPAG